MKKSILYFLICIVGLSAQAQTNFDNTKGMTLPEPGTAKKEKMNVIIFLVDDMGWSDLGCYGSSFYRTPQINRFAKEGVRFTQAYASSHVCSPSRAGIISGEYPARLHLTDWLPGRKSFPFQRLSNASIVQHLPYGKSTLPEALKENGYQTAIFGKWHLGEDSASTQRQGFDLHVPEWNKGWPHGTYFSPYGLKGLEGGHDGEYLTDRLTTEALKWVEKNKDHPFFLFLSHFAVHDPIEGPPKLVEKYENRIKNNHPREEMPYILEANTDISDPLTRPQLDALLQDKEYQGFRIFPDRMVKIKQYQDNPEYAAMVESVDESLGRVRAKLKELGLSDNTIVIFASDNGGMSAANFFKPERDIPLSMLNASFSTSNLPLRGGKGWLYEGGIRVPLIVYWPHEGKHGTVCNVPVINTDFYPTILEMLGIPLPGSYPLDGMSFVPLLKGEQDASQKIEQRAIYWHFPQYSNHGAQSPGGAIRYGDYKLIEHFENYTAQLFDIKTDPGEHHDLFIEKPKKAKELTEMLHAWRKKIHANMPSPNHDFNPALGDQWTSPDQERPVPQQTKKKNK